MPGTPTVLHTADPAKDAQRGAKSIAFLMQTNLVLEGNFITNRFFEVAGNYYGLYRDTNGVVAHDSAGYIEFKTDSKLKFSSKVVVHGEKVGLAGAFGLDGTGTQKKLVYRKNLLSEPIYVWPQIDFDNQKVVGTVSNAGWTASFEADLAVWANTHQPPDTYTGWFTAILPGSETPSVEPGGHGYMTMAGIFDPAKGIDPAKLPLTYKPKGLLGDVQKFKPYKVPVSKDGRWPFYVTAYDGTRPSGDKTTFGSLGGWLQFVSGPTGIVGDLTWTKQTGWNPATPPVPNIYSGGFTSTLSLFASRYVLPPQPPGTPGAHVITITNGTLVLEAGNLASGLATNFYWGDDNKIVFPKGYNPQNLKLAVKTADGSFSGSFVHPGNPAKPTKTAGAVLQNVDLGFGNFPGASTESGSAVVQPIAP